MNTRVRVVEVGPRDGLQNEARTYPVAARAAFIEALVGGGATTIEIGSFVSPRAVPQMANTDAVFRTIRREPYVQYVALVPNERGYDRARECGVEAIALFASATDAFSQANLKASIAESFERFVPVAARAKADDVWLRGYVSVAFVCPFAGRTAPEDVLDVTNRLFDLGCDEVSIADTIGKAVPADVDRLLNHLAPHVELDRIALHFHDTGGQALANVDAGLRWGVTTYDSSAGGLGGCPYAPGAPGNLATEALVGHLHDRGIETGIDVNAVSEAVRGLTVESSLVGS